VTSTVAAACGADAPGREVGMNEGRRTLERIVNRTFDELEVGETATLAHVLSRRDVELFAVMSGDVNPMHVDDAFARSDIFHRVIAHGMWGGALISTVLGTQLPGPGTVYLGQTLRFHHPVYVGDKVVVTLRVAEKVEDGHRVTLDCEMVNQQGDVVISGQAEVMAPTEKVSRPRVLLPEVELLERGRRYRQLIDLTHDLPPIRTAVVHPTDAASLLGAVEAAREELIVPVLIGPEPKIRAAAEDAKIDLSRFDVVHTEHSDAAAAKAVEMARAGQVDALMKGALHTDELLRPVVDGDLGLRTARRISHVFAVDVPSYPRPLLITDAAVNVDPDLDAKRDIVQNAIELAHALRIEVPKVALLSAIETVNPMLRSTVDAAALCKMADRGQLTGALLDGPLAFDNAVSEVAARAKGIVSAVAGHANILLVPDLEAGNMLVKQLVYLADAIVAGIVLGARVPIMLTSRADSTLARLGSCALAILLVHHRSGVQSSHP
jgi:phosphate acetyltransferase/phosphate butyryltransferase